MDYEVTHVDRDQGLVEIRVLNTVFTFREFGNGEVRKVSARHTHSQRLDFEALRVPRIQFLKACRQAHAILSPRQNLPTSSAQMHLF